MPRKGEKSGKLLIASPAVFPIQSAAPCNNKNRRYCFNYLIWRRKLAICLFPFFGRPLWRLIYFRRSPPTSYTLCAPPSFAPHKRRIDINVKGGKAWRLNWRRKIAVLTENYSFLSIQHGFVTGKRGGADTIQAPLSFSPWNLLFSSSGVRFLKRRYPGLHKMLRSINKPQSFDRTNSD